MFLIFVKKELIKQQRNKVALSITKIYSDNLAGHLLSICM